MRLSRLSRLSRPWFWLPVCGTGLGIGVATEGGTSVLLFALSAVAIFVLCFLQARNEIWLERQAFYYKRILGLGTEEHGKETR